MEGHWVMRLECRIVWFPLFHSAVPSVSAGRLQSTLILVESLGSSLRPHYKEANPFQSRFSTSRLSRVDRDEGEVIPTTALGSGSIHHKGARDKGARVDGRAGFCLTPLSLVL